MAIDEAVKAGGKPSDGGSGGTQGVFLTIDQYNLVKESAQAILDALKEVRF